jgi:hypothetical protein
MREVNIDGLDKPVKIRSIRRSEQVGGLDQYGYHLLFYSPPMGPDKLTDRAKTEEGIEKVLAAVIDAATIQAVDDAGGASALREVWFAIVKETYGDKAEEKNLFPAGSSTPTPSGSPTAKPAV